MTAEQRSFYQDLADLLNAEHGTAFTAQDAFETLGDIEDQLCEASDNSAAFEAVLLEKQAKMQEATGKHKRMRLAAAHFATHAENYGIIEERVTAFYHHFRDGVPMPELTPNTVSRYYRLVERPMLSCIS